MSLSVSEKVIIALLLLWLFWPRTPRTDAEPRVTWLAREWHTYQAGEGTDRTAKEKRTA